MITFLPVPDFEAVMTMLDDKRLGGQRVEAKAILKWLRNPERYKNFQNAGFCRMWRGFEPALALYYNAAVREWGRRGYRNVECVLEEVDPGDVKMPPWLGRKELHACHRAALLAKLPEHYGQFGWTEEPGIAYLWPEKQEDGGWELVPPKGGRSQPKSEARKGGPAEPRQHWLSKARGPKALAPDAPATPSEGSSERRRRHRAKKRGPDSAGGELSSPARRVTRSMAAARMGASR